MASIYDISCGKKKKKEEKQPADATPSNMTSGLESRANKRRHEVSVPKRRYSNQCQRGGTRISAKEEVLEQVKRQDQSFTIFETMTTEI